MYTMAPTNVQPVTRYFSQQDKMRLHYSKMCIRDSYYRNR